MKLPGILALVVGIIFIAPFVLSTAPTITIYSPHNTSYNTTSVLLNLSTDVLSNVTYKLNDGVSVALFDNNFAGEANLGDLTSKPIEGSNKIFISASNGTDTANTTIFFTVDTTSPTVNLRSPEDNVVVDSPIQNFDFVSSDMSSSSTECSLYLNGSKIAGPINALKDSKNRLTGALPLGRHVWSVKCKDNAQNTGEASRNITVNEKCEINVTELTGKGGNISMTLENMGTLQTEIDYSIKVNSKETSIGYSNLSAGEKKEALHNFVFPDGTHRLEAVIKPSCGPQKHFASNYTKITQPVETPIQPGVACDCANKQIVIGNNNGTIEEFFNSCRYVCNVQCVFDSNCKSGNVCRSYSCVPRSAKCGVDIQDFDYMKQTAVGEAGKIFANIKNSGELKEDIKINMSVGSLSIGSLSLALGPGVDKLLEFSYNRSVGKYKIVLDVSADCGSSDKEEAYSEVKNVSVKSLPDIALATDISLQKNSLETAPGIEKPLRVKISTTKPQIFSLRVSGVPAEWLSYPSTIGVTNDRLVNIFVKPLTAGDYNITVHVQGTEQNFTSMASLKVETAEEKIVTNQKTIIFLLAAVVIIFVLAFFFAAKHLHL